MNDREIAERTLAELRRANEIAERQAAALEAIAAKPAPSRRRTLSEWWADERAYAQIFHH